MKNIRKASTTTPKKSETIPLGGGLPEARGPESFRVVEGAGKTLFPIQAVLVAIKGGGAAHRDPPKDPMVKSATK